VPRNIIERHITVFDLKRLESYSNNLVDFHLIMDLVPTLAKLHFIELEGTQIPHLSYVQHTLLLGMGL
jgi:N-acetyltransferase 10